LEVAAGKMFTYLPKQLLPPLINLTRECHFNKAIVKAVLILRKFVKMKGSGEVGSEMWGTG
jgi:hypothetical protein